jgi:hypothetical protein
MDVDESTFINDPNENNLSAEPQIVFDEEEDEENENKNINAFIYDDVVVEENENKNINAFIYGDVVIEQKENIIIPTPPVHEPLTLIKTQIQQLQKILDDTALPADESENLLSWSWWGNPDNVYDSCYEEWDDIDDNRMRLYNKGYGMYPTPLQELTESIQRDRRIMKIKKKLKREEEEKKRRFNN